MSDLVIRYWKVKKNYLKVKGDAIASYPVFLYVDWGNGRNSKKSVSGIFSVKIKVKGCPGKINIWLSSEDSHAKGCSGCRPREYALPGEKPCQCGEVVPCLGNLEPVDGLCPPLKPNPDEGDLSPLRITPVTLRTKELVERYKDGFIPVRISWVSKDGSRNLTLNEKNYFWKYTNTFDPTWNWQVEGEKLYVQSIQVEVKEGDTNFLTIWLLNDTNISVQFKYPKRDQHPQMLIIGDPQIYENESFAYLDSHKVLNAVLNKYLKDDNKRIDALVFGGDNFYDCLSGRLNTEFYKGGGSNGAPKLSDNFYTTPTITIIGNHEYSNNGDGPMESGYGRQYLLWFAIDAHTSFWDGEAEFPMPKYNTADKIEFIPYGYTLCYYVIGNCGFITNDNTTTIETVDAKIWAQVNYAFSELKVETVYYISHWHSASKYAKQSTLEAFDVLKTKLPNQNLKLYFTGHKHINIKENGGFIMGGNGYVKIEDPGRCPTCENCPDCCPTLLTKEGEVKQGWIGVDSPGYGAIV